MAKFQNLHAWAVLIVSILLVHAIGVNANWEGGSATFYGDMTGGETMSKGLVDMVISSNKTMASRQQPLSTALFNNGQTCGACFEIMCVNDPQWCIPHAGAIRITATNFCPPNYDSHFYPWCNPPRKHFDLSMPMFKRIAIYKAGIIPVKFRRVSCFKRGGVRFELKGNPYWITATLLNVGGAGEVTGVKIKGSKSNWLQMSRNWGQVWQITVNLAGKSLSFQVTTSDGKTVELDNVAPRNWQFGQTYEGKGIF